MPLRKERRNSVIEALGEENAVFFSQMKWIERNLSLSSLSESEVRLLLGVAVRGQERNRRGCDLMRHKERGRRERVGWSKRNWV